MSFSNLAYIMEIGGPTTRAFVYSGVMLCISIVVGIICGLFIRIRNKLKKKKLEELSR